MTAKPARLTKLERRYSLSTKRGWMTYVNAPEREQPETLTVAELAALSPRARAQYEESRVVWHANIGPIRTPQLIEVHQHLWNIVGSSREDGDHPRLPAVIDVYPGLGKSTIANSFARDWHRRQIELYGEFTEDGHERIPVVRVQLSDETSRRDFNSMLCRFFNLPGYDTGNANHLGDRAADAVIACDSTLILVDDVHFLDMRRKSGRAVANHFKALNNNFPATFLHVGVGLADRGLLDEGLGPDRVELAQNSRRSTPLAVEPFSIADEAGRRAWRTLLLTVEKAVVLSGKYPGMIADDLSDVLFARSSGHFASLMALVRRGVAEAVACGTECLTPDVLARIKNDAAAEAVRLELEAGFAAGKLTSRPARRRPTAKPQMESAS